MDLTGTVALVTGGCGGLGSAAVRELAAAGAHVLVADVADDRGAALAAEVGGTYRHTDVADSASIEAAVDAAAERGPLRAVVVAHGAVSGRPERIVGRDGTPAALEHFTATIGSYLTGTYDVLRLTAAAILRNDPVDADGQRGAIVLTASIAAYEGQIGQAPYAAAKGGVVSLALVAARDLGAGGVRVNCIAPGTMRTPIMESVGEEALAAFAKAVPFPKRLGAPAEYGRLARHLIENDYLNGATIRIDGAQRFGPR